MEDPTRPQGHVTQGPSCRPGGLTVEVVAGSSPYSVRLATTRTPSGEDQATLQPGQTVLLHTGDVAYGETIDSRLEYTALDGSGTTFVDELEEYSFTRPTKKDCDAIADPAPAATPAASASSASTTTASATSTTEAPVTGPGTPTQGGLVPAAAGSGGGSLHQGAPQQVTVGDTVTVEAAGFLPGELVTVQLRGSDAVLGTANAGRDGTVRTEVRIPEGTAPGATTVVLTGTRSETVANVELRVAAASRPLAAPGGSDLVSLVAAAVALVAATGGLFSVLGVRRHRPTIRRA